MARDWRLGNLTTPENIQKLQAALHAKAKGEPGFRFYSLYDKIHRRDVLEYAYACCRANQGAAGVDGERFEDIEAYGRERWIGELTDTLRNKTYQAQALRRVFIPKPNGKLRPLSIPTIRDRTTMMAATLILAPIFEADLPAEQHGYRPERSALSAVQETRELLVTGRTQIVDADLTDYFGSLNHGWILRFLERRVGDPRVLSLIRRWLKAGVLENGAVTANEEGTTQGGSISVMISNVYLFYVLDLWFERVVKPRLRGVAHLIRYIDDFVICFQYREDAERVQDVLIKRLRRFALELEPSKTRLIKFGRIAKREAKARGKRPKTFYFLGFVHYVTRNRKGNFKVGRTTEKSRLRRSLLRLKELMREIRHWSLKDQAGKLNEVLRGHYAYYGVAGNVRSLLKVYRYTERYWQRMLSSRSWKGNITWEVFNQLRDRFPIQRPVIYFPYERLQECAVL